MPIISGRKARAEALVLESKTYMGAPCANGHIGLRYTSNRACISCLRATPRGYDKEKGRIQKATYRARQREAAIMGASILDDL